LLQGKWHGRDYSQVGALFSELESRRHRPRAALDRLLCGCDLIQVVSGIPAPALVASRTNKPVILQVATLAAVERRRWAKERRSAADIWRRIMTSVVSAMDRHALRSVSAIMVENPWMLSYCRELVKGRGVDVRYAPPGIDTEFFCPGQAPHARTSGPYILCVGRLDDPRKNVTLLIRAFHRLVAAGDCASRLLLAGASRPDAEALQLISRLGLGGRVDIEVLPDRHRLRELYRHAACFALPSDEEGLGLVLLEAMSCGAPVVATRCGGPDGIITSGTDGILVERDDEEALSVALATLLKDQGLRSRLASAGRSTAVSRYSLQATGQAFLDLYDELLGLDRPDPGRPA